VGTKKRLLALLYDICVENCNAVEKEIRIKGDYMNSELIFHYNSEYIVLLLQDNTYQSDH
jgi:hypothetical protein